VLPQDMRWFPTVRYFAHRRLWYRSVDPDRRAASIGPGVRTTRALDRHPSRGGGDEDLVTMTSADPVWPARQDDRAVGGGQRLGPLALCRQGGEWPTGRWNRVAEDEPKGETRRRSEPLRLVVLDPPRRGCLFDASLRPSSVTRAEDCEVRASGRLRPPGRAGGGLTPAGRGRHDDRCTAAPRSARRRSLGRPTGRATRRRRAWLSSPPRRCTGSRSGRARRSPAPPLPQTSEAKSSTGWPTDIRPRANSLITARCPRRPKAGPAPTRGDDPDA